MDEAFGVKIHAHISGPFASKPCQNIQDVEQGIAIVSTLNTGVVL
jgi:hypothetical protein